MASSLDGKVALVTGNNNIVLSCRFIMTKVMASSLGRLDGKVALVTGNNNIVLSCRFIMTKVFLFKFIFYNRSINMYICCCVSIIIVICIVVVYQS